MKKRVLSVLLIIALLVAVGIVTAQAETTPEQIIADAAAMDFTESQVHDCPVCGATGATWTALTSTGGNIGTTGHFYVPEGGIALTSRIVTGTNDSGVNTYCIHLNGQTISGGASGSTIYQRAKATLNIMGSGNITGYSGATEVITARSSVVNIYGGTLSPVDGGTYPVVNMTTGSLNVYGGTVNGNIAVSDAGTVGVSGGEVKTLTPATTGATINVSGAPTVGTLDLTSGAVVTVGELTEGASIGVVAGDNAVITANEAAAYVDYFHAEDPYAVTVGDDNKLYCTVDSMAVINGIITAANAMDFSGTLPTYCPACGATGVTWTAATGAAQLTGHYYLTGDLDLGSSHITVGTQNGQDLCLHLNGHKLSGGSVGTTTAHYGAFNVRATSDLNVMAGNGGSIVTGGNRLLSNNGDTVVNFYGGTYSATGETVRMNNATATVSFYGATVTGPVYVRNSGTLNVVNGNLESVVVEDTATAVSVAGAPTIGALDLTSGKLLTVGNLTAGTSIAVAGVNGQAFTNELADANAVKGYFTATDATSTVVVLGNALACEGLSWDTDEEKIAAAKEMDFSGTLPTYCPVCNKASGVTWTALTGDASQQLQGHYYVPEGGVELGATSSSHITVGTANSQTLCVNLNGQTISGGGSNGIFSMRTCVLNVMGNGTVTGGASAGRVFNTNTGTINIYGGTYGVTTGRTVWSQGTGTVNLYDGTINGLSDAFAVYLVNGATFNMEGGTVAGARVYADNGTATNTVTINAGTVEHVGVTLTNLTVNGGTIGQIDVSSDSTATVSGAPVISALNLADDYKITVGALTTGAAIAVNTNGIFTEDFADATAAEAAKAFFTAVDAENNEIKVNGSALECAAKVTEPEEPEGPNPELSIYENAIAMDFSDANNLPTYCPACGATDAAWTALASDVGSAQLQGHYYLADESVDIGANHITVGTANGQTLCVHLNGNALTGGNGNGIFSMRTCTLNVMGDGNVTAGSSAGRVFNTNGGTINLYGGTYGVTSGRVVWTEGTGTVTLNEGTITGQTDGYAVYLNKGGAFVMNGGTVNGARIYGDSVGGVTNTITINGGTISTSVGATQANLTITGGTINQVDVASASTAAISGNPVISALNLADDFKITVGALTEGAAITVSANGVFTNELADANAVKGYFTAADPDASIIVEGNALSCKGLSWDTVADKIAAAKEMDFSDANNLPEYCPICNKSSGVTWTALASDVGSAQLQGHYYLADESVDIGANHITVGTANGQTLCVNLNGQTLTGGNSNGVFSMRTCVLNVMGNGTVTGGASAGRVFNTNTGTINIYGGTYGVTTGRTVWSQGAGTVNLYDGTINGLSDAFAVYLVNGATFNMEGGTVAGARVYADNGTATNTVTINAGTVEHIGVTMANLTVNGGTIGQIDVSSDSTVTVSGNPVVSQMNLADDYKISVGELTTGASITVKTEGVFTNELADAEAVKAYFAVAAGYRLTVEGNALKSTAMSIYEKAVAMDFSDANNLPTYCPACGATDAAWTALASDVGSAQLQGHYYLADESVDIGANHITVGTANGQTLCVHLNGNTLTGGNGNGIFSMRTCVLNVMGDGNVTGGESAGRVFNTNTGTINLYGGTYNTTKAAARTVWSQGAGTLTLHEGTITSVSDGFAVYLNNGATFNMEGGEITETRLYSDNNDSTTANTININGGNVSGGVGATLCNLTISGGTVGTVDVATNSAVVLSGDPTISALGVSSDTENPALTVKADFVGSVTLRNFVLADADPTDIVTRHGYAILSGISEGSYTGTVKALFTTVSDNNVYYVLPTAEGALQIGTTSVVNGETETWFVDTASAVAAANNGGYVKLYTSDDVVLADDVITIDLNGQFVNITGTGTITGFDSATDTFAVGGSAVVTGVTVNNTTSTTVNGKNYIMLVLDGATTFNCYEMKLSGVAIKPSTSGLYYKATWSANSLLKAKMGAGVVVSLKNQPTETFYSEFVALYETGATSGYEDFFHEYAGTDITNGVAKTSVLVDGIMKTVNSDGSARDPETNATNASKIIYANAFIRVGNEIILSDGKAMSILDVLTALDTTENEALYEANKNGLDIFYNTWNAYVPENWFDQFTRIGKTAA